MEEFSVKFRAFSERDARTRKANQIMLISQTVIKGFLMLAFVLQMLVGDAEFIRRRRACDYLCNSSAAVLSSLL